MKMPKTRVHFGAHPDERIARRGALYAKRYLDSRSPNEFLCIAVLCRLLQKSPCPKIRTPRILIQNSHAHIYPFLTRRRDTQGPPTPEHLFVIPCSHCTNWHKSPSVTAAPLAERSLSRHDLDVFKGLRTRSRGAGGTLAV